MRKKLLNLLAKSKKDPDEVCFILMDEIMASQVIMNGNDVKAAYRDTQLLLESVAAQYGLNVIQTQPAN